MEIDSLRLDFRHFLPSHSFFFLSPSTVPLPSSKPQKPKTVLSSSSKSISQNHGFVLLVLPSSSKSISQNPKPISQSPNPNPFLKIPKTKNHVMWACVFCDFLLWVCVFNFAVNPFLKILNPFLKILNQKSQSMGLCFQFCKFVFSRIFCHGFVFLVPFLKILNQKS